MHPFDRRRMRAPRAELRTPPDPNRANRAMYQVGLMHLYQVMALELEYQTDPERASDLADQCAGVCITRDVVDEIISEGS